MKVFELLHKIEGVEQELKFFNQKFIYNYSKESEQEYLALDKYYHQLLNSKLSEAEDLAN